MTRRKPRLDGQNISNISLKYRTFPDISFAKGIFHNSTHLFCTISMLCTIFTARIIVHYFVVARNKLQYYTKILRCIISAEPC